MSAEEQAWLEETVRQIVALKNGRIADLEAQNRELQAEIDRLYGELMHR